jgi:hypothetical protein
MNRDISTPPPPQISGGQSQQNALMMPQPRQMAVPTHAQTVAALRHFSAIAGELKTLRDNPALGKSNIKSEIIGSVSSLVAERVLTPASAVVELSNVPEDPFKQRAWIMMMLQQTIKAQNGVLDHHTMGTPGSLDWATESQHAPYNSDDHHSIMEGLAGNYRP